MDLRRKCIALVVLVALGATASGCRRSVNVPRATLPSRQQANSDKIVEAVLTNGKSVKFKGSGARYEKDQSILSGYSLAEQKVVDIKLDDILYVRVSRIDGTLTAVAVGGIVAGAVIAAVLITRSGSDSKPNAAPTPSGGGGGAGSCPFIYSYDGEKYVLDAEPLSGAIAEGLARTDYSRLDHLRPRAGKYHLLVRNEPDETQFVDQMAFLVADHPAGTQVAPDAFGDFYLLKHQVGPATAVDEAGRDLLPFIREADEVAWQTDLRRESRAGAAKIRHELTFTFPKPAGATTGKLLVRAGASLWGADMVRKMLELRGNRIDAWYDGLSIYDKEFFDLTNFMEREELYVLKVLVKEGE